MKVTMINSVGPDHVAGEEVDVDEETGDRYILLGYAEGELSREYDETEREQIRAASQSVSA